MSILDNEEKKQQIKKTLSVYAVITLFCGFFSWMYEQFSHGVVSDYMIYLFLFPLVGGVLVFAVLGVIQRWPMPSRFSQNAYHAGIATWTVGSALQGALEIYGTTSGYILVYWIAGAVLAAAGIISYCIMVKRGYRKRTFVKRSI